MEKEEEDPPSSEFGVTGPLSSNFGAARNCEKAAVKSERR